MILHEIRCKTPCVHAQQKFMVIVLALKEMYVIRQNFLCQITIKKHLIATAWDEQIKASIILGLIIKCSTAVTAQMSSGRLKGMESLSNRSWEVKCQKLHDIMDTLDCHAMTLTIRINKTRNPWKFSFCRVLFDEKTHFLISEGSAFCQYDLGGRALNCDHVW